VVKGDGDVVWANVIADCARTRRCRCTTAARSKAASSSRRAGRCCRREIHVGVGADVRGCPKHCSFCSVWKTDGQRPRQRGVDAVINEIVDLRRLGFRFIALADDNFYPVTLDDLAMAARRQDKTRFEELKAMRAERFELMEGLAKLPDDMVFFTQITMEAAEDPDFSRR
jgi:tRNA A37 methylthiotransferase MiaB